jgi:hypothetical protein
MGPYEEILRTLALNDVEFIVGGGVACVLHGVERVTMDIDLAVHMRPENLRKFLALMVELGLKPRVPIAPEALMDTRFVRSMIEEKQALVFTFVDPERPIRQLDLFLIADLSYESLLPDSEWRAIDELKVRIIGRARLLAIKRAIRPARAKDALDIEFLSRDEAI